MVLTFLDHQRKEFWRSRNKGGSIAAQLLLGFFMFYFLAVAIGIGFGMEIFIHKVFPGRDVVSMFNGFILYYFLFEFAIRIQLQELPTLSVIPYLHLNIPKKDLIRFLNVKALFSFANFLPLFIFLPFIIRNIGGTYGWFTGLMFIVTIISATLFNNFLVLFIKRKSISNISYFAAAISIIAVFAGLEYFKIISIMRGSSWLFGHLLVLPALAIIFCIPALIIFVLNSRFLKRNLYIEELSKKEKKKVSTSYSFLDRYGRVGELAAMEIKLILRHKRSKSSVIMGGMFLFYGLLFYKKDYILNDQFGYLLFAAVFMTGISILTYGQFMFAWQSSHFDGIISSKVKLKDFIKAKFLLFTISSSIIAILSSFYGFLSWKLLLLHLATYLYNIGFGTVVVLYFAMFNYKRLDITKSASFNWQGVGASQYILSLPFILIPFLLYLPFGLIGLPYWGLFAVGGAGLIMALMRNFWVDYLTRMLSERKYKIAEGFRE